MPARKVLMVVENRSVPSDPRVWAEAMTLREHDFEVCIISPKGANCDLQAYTCLDGIHIYRYRVPGAQNNVLSYLLEYFLSMIKIWWLSLYILCKHGFDVIHAANPPDTFFLLHWFYFPLGKLFIFDQHDLSPELFGVKFGPKRGFLWHVLLWQEKCAYHASALVLTSNESQRLKAITRGKCDPAKVMVVRNSPRLERFQRVPVDLELKHGRTHLLVYIGAMEIQDGVEYALYALHELIYLLGYQDVSLVLLGDGERLPVLKQLAYELDIENYVYFTGWVDHEEIVRYLSTADIGLCPDPLNGLNEYCTTIKTMEYMAMNLPVVAFDLAETRYTAQDTALYATPNSVSDFAHQIARFVDDPELRRSMGQCARERIEKCLNWQQDKQNLLCAYARLFPEIPPFL